MTLEQVAERAEVHVQTLYRHFPTKLSILIEMNKRPVRELESALQDREDGVSTFDVWRTTIRKYSAMTEKGRIPYSPSGSAALAFQLVQDRYVTALTNGLRRDMGISTKTDRRPFLIACMLKQANDIEAGRWFAGGRKGKISTGLLRVVDDIVEHFGDIRIKQVK